MWENTDRKNEIGTLFMQSYFTEDVLGCYHCFNIIIIIIIIIFVMSTHFSLIWFLQ